MPFPISPWSMGTSVRVAKYMKAPATEANRFDKMEFPPTAEFTHSDGMSPSCPGRPSKTPAMSTPKKRSGNICLVNPQVEPNQSPTSPLSVLVIIESPMTPAAKAMTGSRGNVSPRIMEGTKNAI